MLAVFAEFGCSLLLLARLGTRLATIPLLITMLVAAFVAHADDPITEKDLHLLYLLVYGVLLLLGSGKVLLKGTSLHPTSPVPGFSG